jgi:redox-sensitive bicupin YhaK (pirin superfamily)
MNTLSTHDAFVPNSPSGKSRVSIDGAAAREPRRVAHLTRGHRGGPVVRLVSPGDLGELIKPFVFLDYFDVDAANAPKFGIHPHSGIATLTFLLDGDVFYEDSTGKQGVLEAGGVEWMRAGGGVWHGGHAAGAGRMRGFQLWVALPADQENTPAESTYLASHQVPQEGPARVLLGAYGFAASLLPAPSPLTYLAVHLKAGERWRYVPPAGHTVGWVAVHEGAVDAGGPLSAGDLAVFEASEGAIDFTAEVSAGFVLGSAAKHPHDLVLGSYSVHTSPAALRLGVAGIRRIAEKLRAEGRLG